MQCPVCRAENREGPECRRCKADLSLLMSLEQHRAVLLAHARRAVLNREGRRFRELVRKAHMLRADAETRRLLRLAEWMCGARPPQ